MTNHFKYNLFLDLDQTLISAEAEEDYDFKNNKEKAKNFTFKDMEGYYIVFERPGLQKFLTYIFKNFNVSVWTAATKDYALFIIENMILKNHPERKLEMIFFSYHCNISEKIKPKKCIKNLDVIWNMYMINGYSKENTFILDDNKLVHQGQPERCIIAPAFEFEQDGSEHDTFLKELEIYLRECFQSGGKLSARSVNRALLNHI